MLSRCDVDVNNEVRGTFKTKYSIGKPKSNNQSSDTPLLILFFCDAASRGQNLCCGDLPEAAKSITNKGLPMW